MAALSMTVANLAALRQTNIVRLLAYSSIAQAGFMLVPFAAAALSGPEALASGLEATVVYLLIYALMNLGAFAVVIVGTRRTGTTDIAGWAGLARVDPRLAVLTAVFFFSLAGIPPLAGWYAKFKMFTSAIEAGGSWAFVLAAIAALNAVIAFAYYAKVAKAVWFDEPAAEAEEVTEAPAGSLVLVLAIAAAVTLVVGVIPNIPDLLGEATRTLLAAAGG
jgi:NADH-quinone oxidoreductase subunit N